MKPLLCYLEDWESELPDYVRGPIPAWDTPQMLWTAELRLNDGFDEHDARAAFGALINRYFIEAGRPGPGFVPVSRPFPLLMRSYVRDWGYGGRGGRGGLNVQYFTWLPQSDGTCRTGALPQMLEPGTPIEPKRAANPFEEHPK